MPWHDESPWARKRRQTAERKAAAAAEQQARANMESRVEEVRRALKSFDFGGMSVDRFFDEVREIASVARIGEQHKPEIQG